MNSIRIFFGSICNRLLTVIYVLIGIILLFVAFPVHANETDTTHQPAPVQYTVDSLPWCGKDKIDGWDFYCDEVPKPKQKQSKPKQTAKETAKETKAEKQHDKKQQNTNVPESKTDPYPYTTKVKKQQLELEEAKAKAILEPTSENLAVYMYLQQKVMGQAGDFAKTWQDVLVLNPDLDYTLKRPQATLAKQTWYKQRRQDKQDTLKYISERFGIMWFYRSTCPYCHTYAPIIKSFTDDNQIYTIAVSLDGGSMKYWPDARLNTGQAEHFGVADKPVPSTVLYDSQTKTIYVIGYGVMTHQELTDRIFKIMEKDKANDW